MYSVFNSIKTLACLFDLPQNHMCLNAACTCCGIWTPTCGGLLSPLAMALLFPFVCLLLFVCFLITFVAVRIVLDLVAIAVTDLSSVFCIYIPG